MSSSDVKNKKNVGGGKGAANKLNATAMKGGGAGIARSRQPPVDGSVYASLSYEGPEEKKSASFETNENVPQQQQHRQHRQIPQQQQGAPAAGRSGVLHGGNSNQHHATANSNTSINGNNNNGNDIESLDYSSQVESESYVAIHDTLAMEAGQQQESVGAATGPAHYSLSSSSSNGGRDATETVHEMHLALLYLLSNPEEFSKALASRPPRGATTLMEWNNEYNDNESLTFTEAGDSTSYGGGFGNSTGGDDEPTTNQSASSPGAGTSGGSGTPLPFVVFADDAEVVLPQAHTASQLFGIERIEGIELEAAAGIPAISQLFLRWLALMPGGDHLNIIDPPGLTVMRIAGGRYRVTAAHRVVWTWNNQFAPLLTGNSNNNVSANMSQSSSFDSASVTATAAAASRQQDDAFNQLQMGDLVSMTIVDVFETDNQGKLLSYCPTFDNRAIHKTHHTAETLRKGSSKVMTALAKAQKSKLAVLIKSRAHLVARSVKQKVGEAVHSYGSPSRNGNNGGGAGGGGGSGAAGDAGVVNSCNIDGLALSDDMERHEV